MKKVLTITVLILLFGLAENCSDNPDTNKKVCPDCLEVGCIYQDINDNVIGEGTDSEIMEAVQKVTKQRGITDTATINNILANYYL